MVDIFVVALREGLQAALVLILFLSSDELRAYSKPLLGGTLLALLLGFPMSFITGAGGFLFTAENWAFTRYVFESILFFSPVAIILAGRRLKPFIKPVPVMFMLGFLLFFFESRALGYFINDVGMMKEQRAAITLAGLAGVLVGLAPVMFYKFIVKKLPVSRALTLPSILLAVGAFRFAWGGVGEVEQGSVLVSLQWGIQYFMQDAATFLQYLMMFAEHEFVQTPYQGVADFLKGDDMAMTLLVMFIAVPPVLVLGDIFSRPDPQVEHIDVAAERRLELAFFRSELVWRSVPVLLSLIVLVVALHAVNVSLNPLSEPMPIPVREVEGDEGFLRIPLSDKFGDFTDGKLRKYVYFWGSRQINFLAILKLDGTVGLALDDCEICKPAEWNKDAQGYAQRGDHLVCKYCMTPIPLSALNKPGGCNPIPVGFILKDDHVLIRLDDLIRVYKSYKELDKQGTHL